MIATCKEKGLYSETEAKITLTIEGKRNEGVNGSLFLYISLQQHSQYEIGMDYHITVYAAKPILQRNEE